ncbi:MAG: hypothetical protein ABL952_15140, partial [Pyrinomonadaceae bacterium]
MKGLFFDTSVYIQAWRDQQTADLGLAGPATIVGNQPVYLSSVVLQELYIGASQKNSKKAINSIEKRFRGVDRLVTPNLSDWIFTGQVLSKMG